MMIQAESHKSNTDILSLCMVSSFCKNLTVIIIKNLLPIVQFECLLVQAVLNTSAILNNVKQESLAQLRKPEAIINVEAWERVDVRFIERLPVIEQPGGGHHHHKKSTIHGEDKQKKSRDSRRNLDPEEERQQKWEESWEKKLQAQDELDEIPCCSAAGLCIRPKTQSNIWINVLQNRTHQDVRLTFKHVPVPRPKPPPLPKLKREPSSQSISTTGNPHLKKDEGVHRVGQHENKKK